MKENKNIPIVFHLFYLCLAAGLCFLYYKKIVAGIDFNAPNSINAVASFQTAKPYQFRLLVPILFMLFKPLTFISEKTIYIAYDFIIVYFIILMYYKFLCEYFVNKKIVLFLAPVIIYPMLFNYVILNQSFQYYDFTSILLFTIGLYFIIKNNFKWFLISFIVALLSKETAVYLVFCYVLYNYKTIFTKKIIINSFLLGIIFLGYKFLLSYIFRNNPGDDFEVGYTVNWEIITTFYKNRILAKNLALNFGGIYIFTILLFLTGRWKYFTSKSPSKLMYINFAFIPYFIVGIFVTYFTEVRVYSELIPLFTTLFLIYLSTIKKLSLETDPKTKTNN